MIGTGAEEDASGNVIGSRFKQSRALSWRSGPERHGCREEREISLTSRRGQPLIIVYISSLYWINIRNWQFSVTGITFLTGVDK